MRRKLMIIVILAICFVATAAAQNTNTLYFMDEVSTRNLMNPAFLPRNKAYFDFFLLPNVYLGMGESAITLDDNFLKNIPKNPYIKGDFRLNLLNFGFRIKPDHYLIFDFNLRGEISATLPQDLFRLALRGTDNFNRIDVFDFSRTNINSNIYATAGIGYSARVNEKVTVGFKAKYLMGIGNITTSVDHATLTTSLDEWILKSSSHIDMAIPMTLKLYEKGSGTTGIDGMNFDLADLKPVGSGASFDFGITYEPVRNLVISASVVDLGFINWNKGHRYQMGIDGTYIYDGLASIEYVDTSDIDTKIIEEVWDDIQEDVNVHETNRKHTSMVSGNFNIAVEYGILNNRISFGILNQLTFNKNNLYDQLTLAVNFRPCQWFKGTISHSFLNGNWGTLGVGLNLNLGAFDLYLISDYIPVSFAEVFSDQNDFSIIAPNRMHNFNLQFGTIFNIGRFERDLDNDGVRNGRDKCPNTDIDFLRKQCPDLKKKDLVDESGCMFDDDKDGVQNCFDKCPNTPFGYPVDSVGCPLDQDQDGVPDAIDQCPDTPVEALAVDANGCPVDNDADGVPDYIDQCPNTPQNVTVDAVGCPVDSDGDGVPDYLDQCPDTPAKFPVDSKGCPLDQDQDGVPDVIDQCPNTPQNVIVDSVGCPVDSDGDSIPDYLDKCPNRPGVANNNGCPEYTELRNIISKAMTGIQFESAKSVIKKSSYPILNKMAEILGMDTTYNLGIHGHTDNVGNPEKNMKLSKERAEAVRQYLISKGVNGERLTAEGFGDTKPIADNETGEGRKRNRRVEFIIIY